VKPQMNVGGQAVIEGVMMRSPDSVAVAVRKPDGGIRVRCRPHVPWTKRVRALGWPFIRGGVILIESLVLGFKALEYSSEAAMADTVKPDPKPSGSAEKWLMAGTLVFSFAAGLLLFFYLPLLVAGWTGVKSSVAFNLIDGAVRLVVFLAYLTLIRQWKDIRRIFEYHGAEHKSIFAFESGKPLDVDSARPFSVRHPRCGTSFLLTVVWVSILVFLFLGRPDTVGDRLVRLLFLPVIGGLSYEIIRLASTPAGEWLSKTLVAPGVWLQRLTTEEPDDGQIEVALAALRAALGQPAGPSVEQDGEG
jgi:uncharacterized protein YqhQ